MPMASSSTIPTAMPDIDPDIIQAHILTRLDGLTLSSFSCVSSYFHSICTEESLWKALCNSIWPSTKDAKLQAIISTFPYGHRSFFSDSYPTIRRLQNGQQQPLCNHPHQQETMQTSELISAVDIHYGNKIIYSKLVVTETGNGCLKSAPFRLDLLDTKEKVRTPLKLDSEEGTCTARMEKNMRLSWILIDPLKKRTVNLSSLRPVEVRQHKFTGKIFVYYASIMATRVGGGFVKCELDVSCGGKNGGVLHLRDIGMQLEDMEGNILSEKDSLGILQDTMEGKRVNCQIGEEKKMYEMFMSWRKYNISNQFVGKPFDGII